ncbi:hypothetical protein OAT16_11770 [Prolixibacteraceae bacterium]|nr:hypothetical protein [Prolixibacteraceae bacterium]
MKQLIIIIMIFLALNLSAQEKETPQGTTSYYKINVLADPSIGLEHKVGKKGTLDLNAGLNFNILYKTIIPELHIGYRYYFGILRRERFKIPTDYNASDFFLVDLCIAYKNISNKKVYFLPKDPSKASMTNPYGLSWTFQYGTRFIVNQFYIEARAGIQGRWFYANHHTPYREGITLKIDLAMGLMIPYQSKKQH